MSRVEHAVDLYKEKFAPKILVSGGTDKEDGVNEAETMKQIAVNFGVPPNDILLETKSSSTYENELFSKKILQQANMNSIVVVTEPFHAARASLVAKKLDLKYSISPASKSSCWLPTKYFSTYFLKEPVAIFLYWIEGKL